MRYPTRASEPAHRRLRSRLLLCTIHQCKNFTMCPRGDGKPCAVYLTGDIRMGWSGRVPALPAANARSRHRYRQELVPHRRPESARCDRASAEMVAWPGRGATCEPATMPDRHGGLRWRASSQPQAAGTWAPSTADAGEVRAPVFEGTEERLPR